MKDAKRTSFTEFEKWFSKDGSIIPVPGDAGYEGFIERKKAWKAASRMIKYEGVISDYELAGKIIKGELDDECT
jgi:hypothetical protein